MVRITTAKYNIRARIDALTHYGNGKCACVKCGYSDIRALSIDHISNVGTKIINVSHRSGTGLYFWLKRNNYPKGFQTLCRNCQAIKQCEKREFNNKYNHANHKKALKTNGLNISELLV